MRQLLIGEVLDERRIQIGSLIARQDVKVTLSAPKLVARHLAILAMTGGGKTVAARRVIRELINHGYPTIILDPHGDYIGLSRCEGLLRKDAPDCSIKLFFPELLIQKDGEDLITRIIAQMTMGLTEPQSEYLRALYERKPANEGEQALRYIERLLQQIAHDFTQNREPRLRGGRQQPAAGADRPAGVPNSGNWKGTIGAVQRALRIVKVRLDRMERTSEQMRRAISLRDLIFSLYQALLPDLTKSSAPDRYRYSTSLATTMLRSVRSPQSRWTPFSSFVPTFPIKSLRSSRWLRKPTPSSHPHAKEQPTRFPCL